MRGAGGCRPTLPRLKGCSDGSALGHDKGGNVRNGAKVIEREVLRRDVHGEFLFDVDHQLSEIQRTEQARLDQVRVGGRNLKVELVAKELGESVAQPYIPGHLSAISTE